MSATADTAPRDRETHAILWDGGAMRDLGTLGGDISEATALSNAGAVVGNSAAADGHVRAFAWKSGAMTDLGALGGDASAAAAINARGQIAGVSTAVAGKVNHAVLWDNGKIIDLGTLANGASTIDYSCYPVPPAAPPLTGVTSLLLGRRDRRSAPSKEEAGLWSVSSRKGARWRSYAPSARI